MPHGTVISGYCYHHELSVAETTTGNSSRYSLHIPISIVSTMVQRSVQVLLIAAALSSLAEVVTTFTVITPPTATLFGVASQRQQQQQQQVHYCARSQLLSLFSSFTADGSEYAAGESDFDEDDDDADALAGGGYRRADFDEQDADNDDESPTTELQPVPMSKNAGNRFVALVWDRVLQQKDSNAAADKDALDWHHDRIRLTEEHVMFCRKQNLYNETVNTESMVDILWSLPMCVRSFVQSIFRSLLLLDGVCFLCLKRWMDECMDRIISQRSHRPLTHSTAALLFPTLFGKQQQLMKQKL